YRARRGPGVRGHRRRDRCCGKAWSPQTDSRIQDEEARPRPVSLQIVIACGPPTVAARATPFGIPEVVRDVRRTFGECRNYGSNPRAKKRLLQQAPARRRFAWRGHWTR